MADLGSLKRSAVVFARSIGVPLAPFQERAAELGARVTVILAGRQMGKSRMLAALSLWWAFKSRNQTVLLVSASDHAARRLHALAAEMLRGSELLRPSAVDFQRGLTRLTNGSVIRSVAASESSIRGWSADFLAIDECALLPAELVTDAALPTTAARPDARVVLASSASRAAGPFYDLFRQGELGHPDIECFRWVSRAAGGGDDAPWISPTAVELDRAAMSPARFDAEHRAIFAGGGSALFSPQALDRMFVDYTPDMLASLHGPARVCWGQDWGASSDRSAGVALGQIPTGVPGRRLVAVRAVRRWDAGAPLPGVVEEVRCSPGAFKAVVAETNGLGAPCAQLLWAALEQRPYTTGGGRERQPHAVVVQERPDSPFAPPMKVKRRKYQGFVTDKVAVFTSAASKAVVWSAVRLAVDKGELIAPASELELRRELALLEVSLTQAGGEKIEASVGHDDLADALYLACAPFKRLRTGEWSCSLVDILDGRRLLPEVPVPPVVAASPHVLGPDGLMVPVRPAWQSITGGDLTVPDGLDFVAPVDPALRNARARVARALTESERRELESHAG